MEAIRRPRFIMSLLKKIKINSKIHTAYHHKNFKIQDNETPESSKKKDENHIKGYPLFFSKAISRSVNRNHRSQRERNHVLKVFSQTLLISRSAAIEKQRKTIKT